MFGFAVEAMRPGHPVSARGQYGFSTGGSLVARRLSREESCGADCIRSVYSYERLSSASSAVAVVDLLVRSQSGRLRPYVAAGGGLRRYGFSQTELEGEFSTAFSQDVSRYVTHLGAGLEGTAKGVTVQLEFGDYFGRYPSSGAAVVGATGLQHDLSASLGITLKLR